MSCDCIRGRAKESTGKVTQLTAECKQKKAEEEGNNSSFYASKIIAVLEARGQSIQVEEKKAEKNVEKHNDEEASTPKLPEPGILT